MRGLHAIAKQALFAFGLFFLPFSFFYPEDGNVDAFTDLPEFGSFVLHTDYRPADWLKEKYGGKTLLTPINFVIVDSISETMEQSELYIEDLCKSVGYPPRIGHFSEYIALIGDDHYHQMPKKWKTAYSNNPFWKTNNTFRLFGPAKCDAGYVYSGSAMKESFSIIGPVYHKYISYEKAIDELKALFVDSRKLKFAGKMDANRKYDKSASSVGDDKDSIHIFHRI